MRRPRGLWKQCVELHQSHPNATSSEIAAMLGVMPEYVRATFKRKGIKSGSSRERKPTIVRLSDLVVSMLAPFATSRGCSPGELAEQIVLVAVREKIVEAILDDEGDRA